ncbi:MAG: putative acid--amine ligase YjfC [Pelotomaculum sp. PtaB.Bin104]|nr:MAG: putative acid--amine ligase YjfC [Pelotomaculum sp. PtaB.Bin104]
MNNQAAQPLHITDELHYERWKAIMDHPELHFFNWGIMHNCQYATIEPLEINKELLEKIKTATEACGTIFQKAVDFVLKSNQLLRLLGIPETAIDFCRSKHDPAMPVTTIGRFDFAVNGAGENAEIKLLEFNSDTPTGVVEASELNALINKLCQSKNPNQMFAANVKKAFKKFIVKEYQNIVFSSLGWHQEDKGTVLAELAYSGLPAKYVPLDSIVVEADGIIDDQGKRIDLLYRLYPIEWFTRETDGIKLIELAAGNKLDLLNPPSAFVAQSKVMMAIIWELYKNTNFFNHDDKEIISRYFLPVYLDNSYFKGCPYVAKPAFGREGGGVYLYNGQGEIDAFVENKEYLNDMVYQERVTFPLQAVSTWSGEYTGRLLVGSFLIAGEFSGLLLRVGDEITGDMAYFLPVTIT